MIPGIYSHFPFLEFDSVITFQFLLQKDILLLQPLLDFRYHLVHILFHFSFRLSLSFVVFCFLVP